MSLGLVKAVGLATPDMKRRRIGAQTLKALRSSDLFQSHWNLGVISSSNRVCTEKKNKSALRPSKCTQVWSREAPVIVRSEKVRQVRFHNGRQERCTVLDILVANRPIQRL